jgi:pyruvate dehydrogenase E2 component (dihydrolipoamide acetyltransferase)
MKVMATPAAKKAAGERKLDIIKITGTGIGGYIQLSDVLNFRGINATPLARAAASYFGIDLEKINTGKNKITKADVLKYQDNKKANIISLSGIRAVIARRMQESMQQAPQYTNHGEVCGYELKKFMEVFKGKCLEKIAVKPTFSDLLIKATALALRENMMMNSSFHETYIEIHEDINVGLAVALDEGLIVPNIKNADRKSLFEITSDRKTLVDKARAGKLLPEDYSGGTFTISNLGQYPVENFTPIINLPEAAILGVGTMVDRVVPVDGNIGIRPMMAVSVTSDHRHIDGATCGKFMKKLKEIIENPGMMEEY